MAVSEKDVQGVLRSVKDPELGFDVVLLGLVYDISIDGGDVHVTMSLTSPMCPAAGQMVEEATQRIQSLEGVERAEVELTFSPPWTPERMSPLIRASLGI